VNFNILASELRLPEAEISAKREAANRMTLFPEFEAYETTAGKYMMFHVAIASG